MPVTAKEMIQDLLHPFTEAMAEARITPKVLAKKLNKELNAKETKFFAYQGEVVEKRNVIAWGIRQAARIDAQKLLGAYPAETHNLKISGSINLFEKIKEARERAKKRSKD